jgi:transglutaminase-like putative cysteine protease
MIPLRWLFCIPIGLILASPSLAWPPNDFGSGTTYRVEHTLTVKKIPAEAKAVRIWFWVPDDDEAQRVLNLHVKKAPTGYRLTRDACHGHRYLYAEVANPKGEDVVLATSFAIHRIPQSVSLDAKKVGALTEDHRTLFAEYLRRDVPHMEVNDDVVKLAAKVCGDETNVIVQARKLYDYCLDTTNHYSKPGAPKSSGLGSATYCLKNGGGGCTDQHALFIALARARGIPTRLHFGSRLMAANAGKDFDPGYRCWATFFAPEYGWVPVEISAANTTPSKRDFYFGGLDDRRIRFAEGRDLDMTPKQAGPRVNLLIVAHVEVDGQPHNEFSRVVRFDELKADRAQ